MSDLAPEHARELSLSGQATVQIAEAYLALIAISSSMGIRYDTVKTPEEEILADTLGSFVLANLESKETINELPLPDDVVNDAQAWLNAELRYKLLNTMYAKYSQDQQERISRLLAGRTVSAHSLNGVGFSHSDGYHISYGPNSPTYITAPFLSVDPRAGVVWLGTPHDAWKIRMFSSLNADQAAIIEVAE